MTRQPRRRSPRSVRSRPVLRPVAAGLAVLLAAVIGFLPVAQVHAEVAEAEAVRSAVVAPVAARRRAARRRRPARLRPRWLGEQQQVAATVCRLVRGVAARPPHPCSAVVLRL